MDMHYVKFIIILLLILGVVLGAYMGVFASTFFILFVIIFFSIWIMDEINYNMMPQYVTLTLYESL